MIRGEIYGRDVKMQGGPLALLYFRQEFGGDLPSHISSAYSQDPVMIEDFLRVAYVMARVAGDDWTDNGYESWLSSFTDFRMQDGARSVAVISSAIEAELFRARPAAPVRVWRWIKRRVARIHERAGAAKNRIFRK